MNMCKNLAKCSLSGNRYSYYSHPRRVAIVRPNTFQLGKAPRQRRSGALTVQAFFNFFGGAKKEPKVPAQYVEDEALPFPKSILSTTYLKGRRLALAYQASRDGWGAADFHSKADFKGPCVVFAVTTDGAQFGGFNPVGFESTDDYRAAANAFLFALPKGRESSPVILKKVGGPEAAIFDYRKGGPQFGSEGLLIGAPTAPVFGGFAGPDSEKGGFGDLRSVKSRLGLTYASFPADVNQTSLFGGDRKEAQLREMQVFYAPELADMY